MIEQLGRVMTTAVTGSVAQTVGMTISAAGFPAQWARLPKYNAIRRPRCSPK